MLYLSIAKVFGTLGTLLLTPAKGVSECKDFRKPWLTSQAFLLIRVHTHTLTKNFVFIFVCYRL